MLPIALALAIVIILFIVVIAGQPDDFAVSRQTRISAPPDHVFALVNEVRRWEGWNPWSKVDPHCVMTYDGPPSGVGANYAWKGNSKVGQGRNTIVESQPNERVRFRLEFLKPFACTNQAEFTFQRQGVETVVTWTMSGKSHATSKVFGLLMNCDKMIGSQFDNGLAQMKSIAESTPAKAVA
jgi:uncharacterized protein YndB with AHSA1/START domain